MPSNRRRDGSGRGRNDDPLLDEAHLFSGPLRTRSIAANSRRTVTVLMRTLRQGYRGERPYAAVLQSGMTCY
jgi:hypothetical protein